MKTKSNKLAKLERERYSIFTDNFNKCYYCNDHRRTNGPTRSIWWQ